MAFRLPFSRTPQPAPPVENDELDSLAQADPVDEALPSPEIVEEEVATIDPAILAHCNETCAKRAICPLRGGFLQLSQGYDTIVDGFPIQHHADLHAQLHADVAPFIMFLQESREACATQHHDAHKKVLAEKERILPAVKAVINDELGGDLKAIRHLLEHLHAAGPLEGAAIPPRRGEKAKGLPAQASSAHGRVGDKDARASIQRYREAHPDNDATAMWHLLNETGVSLNQVSRLTGWSKGNLSAWKNNPDAQARTSLNQERAQAPPPQDPASASRPAEA
jgi:hypothetical protein